MWNDLKTLGKELAHGLTILTVTSIIAGWIMWYTGHLVLLCNNAGCIVSLR